MIEDLKLQAETCDNDLKALSLYTKILREQRCERFEVWLSKLLFLGYSIDCVEKEGCFIIDSMQYGKLKYYPKANNLLICKTNTWKKPGLKWIIHNLIK